MPRFVMKGFFMVMRVCLHRNLLERLPVTPIAMLGEIFISNFQVKELGNSPTIYVGRTVEEAHDVDKAYS